jgi:hypothetical protein
VRDCLEGCFFLPISGIPDCVNLDNSPRERKTTAMPADADSPLDWLWAEHSRVFRDFDDLSLARWMTQTLGQFEGKAWRLSHPLVGAYRLANLIGNERQIWLQRLAGTPPAYLESPCCRAPFLPLLTRDVESNGLICQHCNETLVPFEEIPSELRPGLQDWASRYGPVHAVAHWDDAQRKSAGDYDHAFEEAAGHAERLLVEAGTRIAPRLLDFYPAVVWEDQDECLEVRPEDIRP